jgi:alpha-glucosidase (family GH31 glycosyl hydrolase)
MSTYFYTLFIILFSLLSYYTIHANYILTSYNTTNYGYSAQLQFQSQSSSTPQQGTADTLLPQFPILNFYSYFEEDYRLHIKILPELNPLEANTSRWEVPAELLGIPTTPPTSKPKNTLYDLQFSEINTIFNFRITRKSTGFIVFNSTQLIYSDQEIQFGTTLPNDTNANVIYGLGEHNTGSWQLPLGTYYLWNAANGVAANTNLYGSHSMYMRMEDNGLAHTLVLRNSNAMQVTLSQSNLDFAITGGIIDVYFLMGADDTSSSQQSLYSQYADMVGHPFLVPHWSLGFHSSKWGYPNISEVEDVVSQYVNAGIPLDSLWLDVDYMQNYLAFSFNTKRFPEDQVATFHQKTLRSNHRHLILALEPDTPCMLTDLANKSLPYSPYVDGEKMGVFIRTPDNSTTLYTRVQQHNVSVAIPDFAHPNITDWIHNQFAYWLTTVGIPSGFWLDLNQVVTLCDGEFTESCLERETLFGPSYEFEALPDSFTPDPNAELPYMPTWNTTNINQPSILPSNLPLDSNALNISAWDSTSQQYNTHNLYPLYQQKTIYNVAQDLTKKRTFILTAASWQGSGKFAAHPDGENAGTFAALQQSIPALFSFSLYGMAMGGSNICGYSGDVSEQLCLRWVQVGAFYPFARTHYNYKSQPRELYLRTYRTPIIKALQLRYSFLPYFYTLMSEAYLSGTPLFRPLQFDFPTDIHTWNISNQFMFGPAVMVLPVITENTTEINPYIPAARWYDYYSLKAIDSVGQNLIFTSSLDDNSTVPILLRCGHMLLQQIPGSTIEETHTNNFKLTALLSPVDSKNMNAHGHNVIDDGISLNTFEMNAFWRIDMSASCSLTDNGWLGSVSLQRTQSYPPYNVTNLYLESVRIVGCPFNYSNIRVTLNTDHIDDQDITALITIRSDAPYLEIVDPSGLLMQITSNIVITVGSPNADNGNEDTHSIAIGISIICLLGVAIVGGLVYAWSKYGAKKNSNTDGSRSPLLLSV